MIASSAEPFARIARRIKDRLKAVPLTARIVAQPNPKDGLYQAEAGLYLAFGSPAPFNPAGGGRWQQLVTRGFQVWIVTQNLLDPAGQDEIALGKHWAVEDQVVNAVIDGAYQKEKIGVGTGVQWEAGGDAVRRTVKTDPGILLSIHLFTVQYPAYVEAVPPDA